MARRKSRSSDAARRQDALRTGALIVHGFAFLRYFLTCSTAIGIAWIVYMCVLALAGKETDANVALSVLGNVSIANGLLASAGASGAAYGLYERHVRKTTVERMSGRIHELEKEIDPKRSTSRLTPRGDTHPEDR